VRAMCYAPHTNLYFDQWGMVKVCCWSRQFPVGDIRKEPVGEIWRGARIQLLREALQSYSFELGCSFCEAQIGAGWLATTAMRNFDQFAVGSPIPEWPQRVELSISNSCNLECVMCNGDFSSAIRAHREHLPPRPKIYPDDFIDTLRPFLPHLKQLKFLGGEPFLVPEYYRLWDMMIEDGLPTRCHLTTNGTQYNGRIERIMAAVPMSFAVSLDGATKATVESIRVNADFDEQLRILRIFRDYTKQRKTDLSLTFCFMRQNWHEFGEYCLFADAWECNVGVNTVVKPPQFGVYTLPAEELRQVLAEMERQAVTLDTRLKRNRKVWFAELERVRLKVQQVSAAEPAAA